MQDDLFALEEENSILEKENESLRSDLEKCKSQLFKLLHRDSQISEASLKNEFTTICESVERWADYAMHNGSTDFKQSYFDFLRVQGRRSKFRYLRPDGDRFDTQWLEWMGHKDTCSYFVLSCIIVSFLLDKIFWNWHPIGVTNLQAKVLRKIIKSMGQDLNKGGQISIIVTNGNQAT